MRTAIASVLVSIGVVAALSSPVSPQDRNLRGAGGEPKGGFVEERGGFDISGPYQVDPNWPKKTWPAPGYIWGSQSGVYPESADKVFLTSRGEIELPKDLKIGPELPGQLGRAQSRRRDRRSSRLSQHHPHHRPAGQSHRFVEAVGLPLRGRPRPAPDLRPAVRP